MKNGTEAKVAKLPKCAICDAEALYDARTKSGQWGYLCHLHFLKERCELGTGRGQILVPDGKKRVKATTGGLWDAPWSWVDAKGPSIQDRISKAYIETFSALVHELAPDLCDTKLVDQADIAYTFGILMADEAIDSARDKVTDCECPEELGGYHASFANGWAAAMSSQAKAVKIKG